MGLIFQVRQTDSTVSEAGERGLLIFNSRVFPEMNGTTTLKTVRRGSPMEKIDDGNKRVGFA